MNESKNFFEHRQTKFYYDTFFELREAFDRVAPGPKTHLNALVPLPFINRDNKRSNHTEMILNIELSHFRPTFIVRVTIS